MDRAQRMCRTLATCLAVLAGSSSIDRFSIAEAAENLTSTAFPGIDVLRTEMSGESGVLSPKRFEDLLRLSYHGNSPQRGEPLGSSDLGKPEVWLTNQLVALNGSVTWRGKIDLFEHDSSGKVQRSSIDVGKAPIELVDSEGKLKLAAFEQLADEIQRAVSSASIRRTQVLHLGCLEKESDHIVNIDETANSVVVDVAFEIAKNVRSRLNVGTSLFDLHCDTPISRGAVVLDLRPARSDNEIILRPELRMGEGSSTPLVGLAFPKAPDGGAPGSPSMAELLPEAGRLYAESIVEALVLDRSELNKSGPLGFDPLKLASSQGLKDIAATLQLAEELKDQGYINTAYYILKQVGGQSQGNPGILSARLSRELGLLAFARSDFSGAVQYLESAISSETDAEQIDKMRQVLVDASYFNHDYGGAIKFGRGIRGRHASVSTLIHLADAISSTAWEERWGGITALQAGFGEALSVLKEAEQLASDSKDMTAVFDAADSLGSLALSRLNELTAPNNQEAVIVSTVAREAASMFVLQDPQRSALLVARSYLLSSSLLDDKVSGLQKAIESYDKLAKLQRLEAVVHPDSEMPTVLSDCSPDPPRFPVVGFELAETEALLGRLGDAAAHAEANLASMSCKSYLNEYRFDLNRWQLLAALFRAMAIADNDRSEESLGQFRTALDKADGVPYITRSSGLGGLAWSFASLRRYACSETDNARRTRYVELFRLLDEKILRRKSETTCRVGEAECVCAH